MECYSIDVLKIRQMNIEINQYSYLSPKNNKQKEVILDTNTRMAFYYANALHTLITKRINTYKSL